MADLADTRQHEALVDSCWNAAGGIDIWVNNAGADVLTGSASAMSFDEKLEQLWRVDVRGSIGISRRIGSRMKKRGRGVILNMGWDQAISGMGGDSGELFSAIKGAVMSFSQSLARSLAPQVRVNCLAPGWIKTAWGQQASDDWQSRAQQECLLQRWGSVQDVAKMARFLASPEAEFITAQIVPINGGFKHSC
jgi:3-oxoacyl-[acyl-carrier protein] reductase